MKQHTDVKTYRYWSADFARGPHEWLGMRVDRDLSGLKVAVVHDRGAVVEWNRRCLRTFPPDAIREGDVILSVNQVGHGAVGPQRRWQQMGAQLLEQTELFLEMRRTVSTGSCDRAA